MDDRRKEMYRIDVRTNEELYALILGRAKLLDCSLGEVLTRTFADTVGKPALGVLPKGKPGPMPGLKQRNGHRNGNGRKKAAASA